MEDSCSTDDRVVRPRRRALSLQYFRRCTYVQRTLNHRAAEMTSVMLSPFLQENGAVREVSGPGARHCLHVCEHPVCDGNLRTGMHWYSLDYIY